MSIKVTGYAEIDRQHRLLEDFSRRLDLFVDPALQRVRMSDEPGHAVGTNADTALLADLAGELLAFLAGHCAYEERLMDLLPDTPDCRTHIQTHTTAHHAIVRQFGDLVVRLESDSPNGVAALLKRALDVWLGEHGQRFDVPLITQLKAVGLEMDLDRELVKILDRHVFRYRPSGGRETGENPSGVLENPSGQDLMGSLTPRQREVCALVVGGSSNREIAERLGTATSTVKSHRIAIFRKMGVGSLVELIRKVGILYDPSEKPPIERLPAKVLQRPERPAGVPVLVTGECRVIPRVLASALDALGYDSRAVPGEEEISRALSLTPAAIVVLCAASRAGAERCRLVAAEWRKTFSCRIVMIVPDPDETGRSSFVFDRDATAWSPWPVDFRALLDALSTMLLPLRPP